MKQVMDAYSYFQERITFGQFYILVYLNVLAFDSSLVSAVVVVFLLCLTHFVWKKAGFGNKAKGAFDSLLVSVVVTLIQLRLTRLL